MSNRVQYLLNMASSVDICEHLICCDTEFSPFLSSRVVINDYAHKLKENAVRFEAWVDHLLIGLVAAYSNDKETLIAYVTSVSVLNRWGCKGIAPNLMEQCIKYVKAFGMQYLQLEVGIKNIPAIRLYTNMGFIVCEENELIIGMSLDLTKENANE